MQSEDAAEPLHWDVHELKRSIDEWEVIAAHIILLIDQTAAAASSQNWHSHRHQILPVVQRFQELCRRESEQLGHWREDGLGPDEVYDRVWDAGDQLVQWLKRMMRP